MTGQATRELGEADFQKRVMDTAKLHGWKRVHIRAAPQRRGQRWTVPYEGDTGLPDLILARDGVVLLVELKAETTPWQPGQREWLAAAGPYGYVWRPADWDTALAVLSAPRRATDRPETEETPT